MTTCRILQFVYLVGCDRKRSRYRILRLDRCPPASGGGRGQKQEHGPGTRAGGGGAAAGASSRGDGSGPNPSSEHPPLPKSSFTCLGDILYEYPQTLSARVRHVAGRGARVSSVLSVFGKHAALCWRDLSCVVPRSSHVRSHTRRR